MVKKIKVYDLNDPLQYEDEKNFWKQASIEFKLNALEEIRESYFKLKNISKDEFDKGLRRLYRVTEQKRS